MKQRLLSILLSFIIIFSVNPAAVYAAAEASAEEPAVTEVLSAESIETETFGLPIDIGAPGEGAEWESGKIYDANSREEFAAIFKECALRRETPFTISIDYRIDLNGEEFPDEDFDAACADISSDTNNAVTAIALAHTGKPTEGDYIAGQLAWQRRNNFSSSIYGDNEYAIITTNCCYNITYYTSVEEEQKVDTEIERILSDGTLDLKGLSDYFKIKAIHDFICRKVHYDNVNVNNDDYLHQYTPYAALFDETAVCQGYALLFYRLCLEAGIDARFLSGDAGGPHSWNIVKLGRYYYYLDATWDDPDSAEDPNAVSYNYFLKGADSAFSERKLDPEYLTEEFKEAYPIADTDYSYDEFDDYTDEYPSFTKVSLVLGGQIGVNFFVKLPYIEDADYDESRVEFKIGNETEPSVVVPINPDEKSANGLFYKFTCPINSIQMGDTITAAYYYNQNGEEYFSETTYTAQQYITDYMKGITESEQPDEQLLITNVVKSLADYGYYAQQYLSSLRGWTIGEDGAHAAMAAPYTTSYSYDEILKDIGETKASVKCSKDITEITSSLLLDSNTELVVYFKPADGYDGPIEIFVEDQRIEQPEQLPDGRCRIYITNIGASRLSSASYTITAKTTDGEATAVVDIFSYLAALLKANKDDSRVINLVGSMVEYARAAEAYVS